MPDNLFADFNPGIKFPVATEVNHNQHLLISGMAYKCIYKSFIKAFAKVMAVQVL